MNGDLRVTQIARRDCTGIVLPAACRHRDLLTDSQRFRGVTLVLHFGRFQAVADGVVDNSERRGRQRGQACGDSARTVEGRVAAFG